MAKCRHPTTKRTGVRVAGKTPVTLTPLASSWVPAYAGTTNNDYGATICQVPPGLGIAVVLTTLVPFIFQKEVVPLV
jgi:hypothetical protein